MAWGHLDRLRRVKATELSRVIGIGVGGIVTLNHQLEMVAILSFIAAACDQGSPSEWLAGTGGAAGSSQSMGGSRSTSADGITLGSAGGTASYTLASDCHLIKSCEPGPIADPGTPFAATLSPQDQQDLTRIAQQLPTPSTLTVEQFAARYPSGLTNAPPPFDATTATGLQTLQASSLALNAPELAQLKARGFVITEREKFPSYVYGYETFYNLDLPLYVSADSVLYALHQSYDSILRDAELFSLIPTLRRILTSTRSSFDRAREAGVSEVSLVDADLYLTVAMSLLEGKQVAPVAGASAAKVGCILSGVAKLDGCVLEDLFGASHVFDFSQFTIRGHYTSSPELGRYFQAMMWLGRTDFRFIDTLMDGSQVFRRQQFEAALALRALFDDASRADWQQLDKAVGAFVGEHDSMTLPQLDALMGALNAGSIMELAAIPDATIAQAIIAGRYGTQRIASQIMVTLGNVQSLTLPSAFLLFGQRYIVDSHVLSNVVFDRVNIEGTPKRMLPNPLDVAFAAFGNNQAGDLLSKELEHYGYAAQLTEMRVLVDEHPDDYWDGNLYNHWIGALRKLSSVDEARRAASVGLPFVASTDAWGRRLINTQLASWSELRHDTLLYAKQSYTTGMTLCEYPDAYVEPYPAFWAQLVELAEHGKAVAAELDVSSGSSLKRVTDYFEGLRNAATILQQMAERQRTGAPHDPAHIAFINQAVRTLRGAGGCGGGGANASDASGWYADLFYNVADKVAYDPNIADVHTQPTDEEGGIVGKVLHVATGMPRLMVVAAENCTGPRAYVGLASSYFERVTGDFKRLTDEEWAEELLKQTPSDVAWMSDIVVH